MTLVLCQKCEKYENTATVPVRLKPVHKIEGMTNGTAAAAGQQQQQQQQGSGQVDISTQVQQYQQFLGEDSISRHSVLCSLSSLPSSDLRAHALPFIDASRALPEFPEIDLQGKSLPEGVELEHIKSFQLLYREHCEVKPTLPARAAAGSVSVKQTLQLSGLVEKC